MGLTQLLRAPQNAAVLVLLGNELTVPCQSPTYGRPVFVLVLTWSLFNYKYTKDVCEEPAVVCLSVEASYESPFPPPPRPIVTLPTMPTSASIPLVFTDSSDGCTGCFLRRGGEQGACFHYSLPLV